MTATPTPAGRAPRRLGVSVVLPPTAWALHLAACAVVTQLACEHGRERLARGLIVGLTAAGLVLTLGSLVAALRGWRALHGAESVVRSEGRGTLEMAAVAGVAVSVLFALAIVWGGLSSVLVANLCGARR